MVRKVNERGLALAAGLLINSAVLITGHYIHVPDLLAGAAFGLGAGIMLLPHVAKRLRIETGHRKPRE